MTQTCADHESDAGRPQQVHPGGELGFEQLARQDGKNPPRYRGRGQDREQGARRGGHDECSRHPSWFPAPCWNLKSGVGYLRWVVGISTTNSLPLEELAARVRLPPCTSATHRAIESPRPAPLVSDRAPRALARSTR